MTSLKNPNVWMSLALALTIQACGKSKNGNQPEAIPPMVEITGQQQDGEKTIVNFKSPQENARYECRIDRGQEVGIWTECNDRNFAFNSDGSVDVKFNVRAKNGDLVGETKTIVIPKGSSSSAFRVVIVEKNNREAIHQGSGNYRITFYAEGASAQDLQYMCKLDNKDYTPCTSPYTFQANSNGSLPNVSVYAINPQTRQQSIEEILYLQGADSSGQIQGPLLDLSAVEVQLGDFYDIHIPTNSRRTDTQFYIAHQVTSKTDNTELDVYRVTEDYDPRYVWNTSCMMEGFRPRRAITPSGKEVIYCNGTPSGEVFKWMVDHRVARNHLELITEPAITNQTGERTIVAFNAFDGERDLMQQRTRFDRECLNSLSGIQYVGAAKVFEDFYGREVYAAIYSCEVQKSSRDILNNGSLGPALGGKRDLWHVSAAFIIRHSEAYLPRHQNQCRPVQKGVIPCWDQIMPKASNILEVMIKTNQRNSLYLSTGSARQIINQLVVPIR